jgi:hypothetical protein
MNIAADCAAESLVRAMWLLRLLPDAVLRPWASPQLSRSAIGRSAVWAPMRRSWFCGFSAAGRARYHCVSSLPSWRGDSTFATASRAVRGLAAMAVVGTIFYCAVDTFRAFVAGGLVAKAKVMN